MSEKFTTQQCGDSISIYSVEVWFSKPSDERRAKWFEEVQKQFGERFELSGPFCRAETRDTGFAHHYTLYTQGKTKMQPHICTNETMNWLAKQPLAHAAYKNAIHPHPQAEIQVCCGEPSEKPFSQPVVEWSK